MNWACVKMPTFASTRLQPDGGRGEHPATPNPSRDGNAKPRVDPSSFG